MEMTEARGGDDTTENDHLGTTDECYYRLWKRVKRDIVEQNAARAMLRTEAILSWLECSDPVELTGERFQLSKYSDADAIRFFRFDRPGIVTLARCLRLPTPIVLVNGGVVDPVEAVAVLLYRLSYPRQLADMTKRFRRDVSTLSRIYLFMIDWIVQEFKDLIYFANDVVSARMRAYCRVVKNAGASMDTVFGFIDGTKVPICRPQSVEGLDVQRACFSGHKRQHCLSFQGVVAPDGLFIHFWGPVEGSRHDATLLRMSELFPYMESRPEVFSGCVLYGDPAYPISDFITAPHKGTGLTSAEKQFNKDMSSVRESVEWGFGRIKTLWSFLDYRKQQKIGLSPVGKAVLVGAFLTNCHTCYFGGNQISDYFRMRPPTLEEYLGV